MRDMFFMLYVEGALSPAVRHYSVMAANDEAERLARVTGKRVHILAPLDSCKAQVSWRSDAERGN